MNTKHTPGPWVLGDSDLYCSSLSVHCGTRQGHTTICRMVSLEYGIGVGEVEANCRLISAAPELLEACRQMMRWFEVDDDHSQMPEFIDRVTLCKQVEFIAASAIAKATGGAQ